MPLPAKAQIELFSRNMKWAKPSPSYSTALKPEQEQQFSSWVSQNKKRIGGADVNDPYSDYDYRGWWLDNKGTPAPEGHFTDKYKTPYHETFSNESQYAKPEAPTWQQKGNNWLLIDNAGNTLYQE